MKHASAKASPEAATEPTEVIIVEEASAESSSEGVSSLLSLAAVVLLSLAAKAGAHKVVIEEVFERISTAKELLENAVCISTGESSEVTEAAHSAEWVSTSSSTEAFLAIFVIHAFLFLV